MRFAGGGFLKTDPGSLLDVIAEAEADLGGKPALLHYLAIPPTAFARTTEAIKEHGLAEGAKAVYEKPYGTSTASFEELDELVHSVFDEEQVYRIDHFLGKEATQNLHLVRFANRLFGDSWSAEHLDQVQIDVPENWTSTTGPSSTTKPAPRWTCWSPTCSRSRRRSRWSRR